MYFLPNILDFGNFTQNNFDVNKDQREQDSYFDTIWVINRNRRNVKTYTYAEAINLTGHGRYSIGLLAVNCLALIGMGNDMYGFPGVVSESACDLKIGTTEKNILLSIPFIGTIISAYWWGYISDTRGRKISLQIAMWGGFIAAILSSLSPDWITLAVLKLISVSFCGCAQSVTYTWLGESCAENIKSIYYVLLTTTICSFPFPFYITMSYFVSTLDFSIDLYFISFVPWRLLALILAIPLGISALYCHFFYESPKFLFNIGNEKLALDILRKIWRKNRGLGTIYPVQKVILDEEGYISVRNKSFLKSLWDQTVPLFKKPLVLKTLQLYYLVISVYVTSMTFYVLFPFITNALLNGISSLESGNIQGLCEIISYSQTNVSEVPCDAKTNITVVWTSIVQGLSLLVVNLSLLKLASRKKLLMIVFMSISSISAAGVGASKVLGVSIALYYVMPIILCGTGLLSSYFVDLYPTSYCGMAACLGGMIGRLCGVFTVNVIGIFIISECSTTFYLLAANLLGGVIVAFFLPPDNPNKGKS